MTVDPVSRRRFLAGAGAACTAGFVAPLLRPQLAFAANGSAAHTLVVVVLQGGLDGISALVPSGDPAYSRLRRATLVPDSGVFGVDRDFALHPGLAPLADLWTDGMVAAVPAVGTATRSRSHFAEAAVVAAGTGGGAGDGTGWLSRHLLTRSGGSVVTLQGVSCGHLPAMELAGHGGAFHVPDLDATGVGGWAPSHLPIAERALAAAYGSSHPQLAAPAAVAFDALGRLRASGVATARRADRAGDVWAQQLQQVARLVRAGIGMEAAVVSFPGWDTHNGQGAAKGQLAGLLDRLSRALATFAADLHDQLDRVTVVVLSEFGRRAAENSSGGTDHGRGGLALVVGRGIAGGVHGTWPGLDPAALDEGDVPVATDIRSVLAEVVRGRLGNPSVDRVFPGFAPVPLGIA